MNVFKVNGVWLAQCFFGTWDVITHGGEVIANDLTRDQAYAVAEAQ